MMHSAGEGTINRYFLYKICIYYCRIYQGQEEKKPPKVIMEMEDQT